MKQLQHWFQQHWKTVLIHASVWILYLLVNNILLFINQLRQIELGQMFYTYALVAVLFYVNVYFVIIPCMHKRQYIKLMFYTVLLICTYIVIRYLLFTYIFPMLHIIDAYRKNYVMMEQFLPDSIWIACQYILFSYGYWFALRSVQLEQHKRKIEQEFAALERERAQAELAFLRSQLNPHFLYNTLNFFFSDALQVSPRLADSIMALSTMLRNVTEIGKQSLVPIGQELDYIRNYIKIQCYRFGDQLQVYLDIEGDEYEDQHMIPPLLFISLVENIFKYGDVYDNSKPVHIRICLSETKISFYSENPKKATPNYIQGGLGLKNIQNQLKIIYKSDFSFEVTEENNIFYVNLNLPLLGN